MVIENIQTWLDLNPDIAPWALTGALIVIDVVSYLIARYFLARVIIDLTTRTKTKIDDILVKHAHPYRLALLAPLVITYALAPWFGDAAMATLQQIALLAILWLVVITLNGLFMAVNVLYEASENYRGVSIQSYLDLGKLLVLIVGVILTIAQITGQSPVVVLSGLGAIMAVLVLVFHDTLLSFVASLQIQSHDLVREKDWIEMPAYDADGEVVNIALHTIKVQNWDNTITVVPTHKLLDTPYRNWRGMEERGGRRIKRAIYIDLNSIKFCNDAMVEGFCKIGLIKDFVEQRLVETKDGDEQCKMDVCEKHQLTNVGVFREYMTSYLKSRGDLHQGDMTLLVRQLDPSPSGLPLEVYAFTKTTAWEAYEAIQADIFEHLVAAAPQFGLKVFQQPTGADFRALISI